jgi:PAS domain S-box-containing protein
LTSQTRHEAVLDEILAQAQRIVPFKTANITLLQEDTLYVARRQGYQTFKADQYMATLVQPLSDFPIDAEAIRARQPVVVCDTRQDSRWTRLDKTAWIRACLLMPICLRDRVLGLLRMDSDVPGAFTEKDAQRLRPLANAAAIAIENAHLVEGLEAEVAARTLEIRTEKEKIETILRHVGDAILMVDAERHIQYINKGYTALTGYTLDEVRGKMANTIGAILSEKSEQLIHSTLDKGELWQGEVIARRKDGRTYDAALTIVPMYDADNHFIGYVASHRDISRFKELERARSRFIANVSHQFRTPVTTLKLQAYMIKRREPLEENLRYLTMMEQQIAQLDHLTQDILDMAALDSGQVVWVWDPIDLTQTFDTLRTRHQSQAKASGLTLHMQLPAANLSSIKGDQVRFTRALSEIVENAIKFTPAGGSIMVKAENIATNQDKNEPNQTWVAISVQDTGPGISAEEQGKVFDNFFRGSLAEAGHIPGTGLGLSVAQEIIRAHGGKITVNSQIGKGTTFTVWLPTRAETFIPNAP